MARDDFLARRLYRKVLALYPSKFRQHFGESMEQSFADLCQEWQAQPVMARIKRIIWLFGETLFSIGQEHLDEFRKGVVMKTLTADFRPAALISLALTAPFALLEIVNQPVSKGTSFSFPIPLFVILWLAPLCFLLTLLPMVRTVRAGDTLLANPALLLVRVVLLTALAFVWLAVLNDQMTCFFGVSNCD